MACAACGPRCGTAVSARKIASRPGCCSGHDTSSCAAVCVGAPMPWLCRNMSCAGAPRQRIDPLTWIEVHAAQSLHVTAWMSAGFKADVFDALTTADVGAFGLSTLSTLIDSDDYEALLEMGESNWWRRHVLGDCGREFTRDWYGCCARALVRPTTTAAAWGTSSTSW